MAFAGIQHKDSVECVGMMTRVWRDGGFGQVFLFFIGTRHTLATQILLRTSPLQIQAISIKQNNFGGIHNHGFMDTSTTFDISLILTRRFNYLLC